jgi:YegS/Rv2252/BmrU family lipid kinase
MQQNGRVSLIVNAESGNLDMDDVLPVIFDAFPDRPPLARFVSREKNARELAAEELADGASMVVAVGGDGTVSQVAAVVAHSPAALGVIPVGTANAFARALGIPLEIPAAAQTLRSAARRTVDLGQCRFGDGQVEPFVLLAAIGYEAEVVRQSTRERKELLGALAYLYTGLELLTGLAPFDLEIDAGDRSLHTRASAVTIANAAPSTSPLAQGLGAVVPDDGLLEVTIFSPASPADAFTRMVELFGSAALDLRIWRDDVIAFRTSRLRLRTEPQQSLAIDGEMREAEAPEFTVEPACLRVVVPHRLH